MLQYFQTACDHAVLQHRAVGDVNPRTFVGNDDDRALRVGQSRRGDNILWCADVCMYACMYVVCMYVCMLYIYYGVQMYVRITVCMYCMRMTSNTRWAWCRGLERFHLRVTALHGRNRRCRTPSDGPTRTSPGSEEACMSVRGGGGWMSVGSGEETKALHFWF